MIILSKRQKEREGGAYSAPPPHGLSVFLLMFKNTLFSTLYMQYELGQGPSLFLCLSFCLYLSLSRSLYTVTNT